MLVRVVLKDDEVYLYRNVYKISNISFNSNNDYLNIFHYSITLEKYISTLIKFEDIFSYEISNVVSATNMYSLCSSSDCSECCFFNYKKLKCNIGGKKNEFKKIK